MKSASLPLLNRREFISLLGDIGARRGEGPVCAGPRYHSITTAVAARLAING